MTLLTRTTGISCAALLASATLLMPVSRAQTFAPITLEAKPQLMAAQPQISQSTFEVGKPKGGCRTWCKILIGSVVLTALGVGGYYLSKASSSGNSSSAATSTTTCRSYSGYNSSTVTCTSY